MCQVWDFQCKTREAAGDAVSAVVGGLVGAISEAQNALITATVTWWLYLPSVDAGGAPAAHTLQRWMLPFAILVVTGGILWQSLMLIINRKGEPLVAIVKGLFTTAIWGAVSLAGTQLLLQACDAWTEWVLTYGLDCKPGFGQDAACKTDALGERMQFVLTPVSLNGAGVLIVIVGLFALLASITQAMLLLFRNGAIIVLAGMLQLSASGSFTSATSNWLRRILGWLLALTFYKPFAATTYAVSFMLIGDRRNTDVATWFTGVAMLAMSIIALPAMMKFFNWTVGAVQSTGGSAGMLAATGAAGMHALSSQRGAGGGGLSATDYARDLDRRYQPPSGSNGSGSGPTPSPGPKPPSFTGPSPAAPSASAPVGAAGSGGAASGLAGAGAAGAGGGTAAGAGAASGAAGASGGAATGAGAATAGAATAGAGAAAGAGAGAGTAATAGAAAAAGPAAPIVAGAMAVGKAVGTAAKSAADTAARSTGEG
ncbi:hypothetical protein [Virgisporangium aurantiacum]|uniref:TrbL/VirB6 plasmid conjugal transfer protein n=1 Tax=Virgisporangium aurantiacum TaxID=175570 RepID=A0A8J4DZR1_9ACTN|nr:hypothetical protein [Virgisporangium aurantiacum]GIJ56184.1 hypothetical protein Vau01_037000 [Virgisporangium aurantiacum]